MTTPPTGVGDWTPTVTAIPSDVLIGQKTGLVISAASSQVFGPYAMTSPAYAIAVDALVSASATVPFLSVLMTWTDPSSGLTVGEEKWYITGTSTSPAAANALTIGRGPTKAGKLTVTITNYDPATSAAIDLAVWQSSRMVTRDDWRGLQQGGVIPGYTSPDCAAAAGMLGWMNSVTIGAGNSETWCCALYAGQAQFIFGAGSTPDVNVALYLPAADFPAASWPFFYNQAVTAITTQLYLPLPRGPVILHATNFAASAVTVTWSLAIQEFAS